MLAIYFDALRDERWLTDHSSIEKVQYFLDRVRLWLRDILDMEGQNAHDKYIEGFSYRDLQYLAIQDAREAFPDVEKGFGDLRLALSEIADFDENEGVRRHGLTGISLNYKLRVIAEVEAQVSIIPRRRPYGLTKFVTWLSRLAGVIDALLDSIIDFTRVGDVIKEFKEVLCASAFK